MCSQLSQNEGDPCPSHSLAPVPLTSGCHFRAWTDPEWTCPPFRRLSRMLQAVAPRGQQRPTEVDSFIQTPLFSCLCPWPLSSQPAHQPSALLLAWLLTSLPFPFVVFCPLKCQSLAWDSGGWLCPTNLAQPPARLPAPCSPASHPSFSCPRPLTWPGSAPLTISPLWVWPLTSSPLSQFPHSSVLGPSVPGSQALSLTHVLRPSLFSLILSCLSPSSLHSFACSLTLSLSRCPPLSPPPLCFS